MKKRLFYELIVGVLMLVAVLLFGMIGFAVLALLGFHPLIYRKKADERECILLYKIGNFTAGIVLIACVLINLSSDLTIHGQMLGKNWFGLIVAVFLAAHGAFGVYLFQRS
jgi:hypothetical protein